MGERGGGKFLKLFDSLSVGLSVAHFHIRIKTIVHLYNFSQLLNSDILFEKVLGFFVFCCEAAPVQSSCDAEIRASFLQKHKSGMRTSHLSLSSYLPQKILHPTTL